MQSLAKSWKRLILLGLRHFYILFCLVFFVTF
nr:MAG TPA: hypothetical protein [Caudoviricetes sp.]